MAKVKTIIMYLSVILLTTALITGCASAGSEKENAAFAVVVGKHSNARVIPFNSEVLQEALSYMYYRCAYVTFINCDADPEAYFQVKISEPSIKNLSKEKQKEIADQYIRQLLEAIKLAEPDSNEFDTLEAISKAAQALAVKDSVHCDKDLLILDSGLSTAGYLNFVDKYLYCDINSIVSELQMKNALPDLTGVDVSWAFCGDVSYPQEPLTEGEKKKLRSIWEAILLASGARSVNFRNDFSSQDSYTNLPLVSTVEVGDDGIHPSPEDEPIETFVLDSKELQFIGDQAVFLNKDLAYDAIADVAEQLSLHSENKVYVLGTTATGSQDFCRELSNRRAKAVTDVLIEMGIEQDRLIPIGLGFEDYWHKDDLDQDGNLLEEEASINRKVMIIDVNGEDAAHIN